MKMIIMTFFSYCVHFDKEKRFWSVATQQLAIDSDARQNFSSSHYSAIFLHLSISLVADISRDGANRHNRRFGDEYG